MNGCICCAPPSSQSICGHGLLRTAQCISMLVLRTSVVCSVWLRRSTTGQGASANRHSATNFNKSKSQCCTSSMPNTSVPSTHLCTVHQASKGHLCQGSALRSAKCRAAAARELARAVIPQRGLGCVLTRPRRFSVNRRPCGRMHARNEHLLLTLPQRSRHLASVLFEQLRIAPMAHLLRQVAASHAWAFRTRTSLVLLARVVSA